MLAARNSGAAITGLGSSATSQALTLADGTYYFQIETIDDSKEALYQHVQVQYSSIP